MIHENIAIVAYSHKRTKAIGSMRIVKNGANEITAIVSQLTHELVQQVAGMKIRLDKEKQEAEPNEEIIKFLEENIAYQEELNVSSYALIANGMQLLKEYNITHLNINDLKKLMEEQKQREEEQKKMENMTEAEYVKMKREERGEE